MKVRLRIGGVAVDAGPVPAIEGAGPVVSRAGFCGLARAEPEPFPFVRVPCDIERLQPAAADIDEILLQRLVGECVFDLEFAFLAVRPLGSDEEPAFALEEASSRCRHARSWRRRNSRAPCFRRQQPSPWRGSIWRRLPPDRRGRRRIFARRRIRRELRSSGRRLMGKHCRLRRLARRTQ